MVRLRLGHQVLGAADLLEAGAGGGHDGLHGVHQGVRGQVINPQEEIITLLLVLSCSV